MIARRKLLKVLSGIPFLGSIGAMGLANKNAKQGLKQALLGPDRDLFKELGVRTFINAAGPFTSMTGCLMPDEVLDSIKKTGQDYVNLVTLQDKVGERIAELLQCEAAVVSSGCFGAMSIGTAGLISGMDQGIVQQLPYADGLKNEVIIQESHLGGYTKAMSNVGANLISVKTAVDVKAAINDKTAMLWFLNKNNNIGEIDVEEWVALGQKYSIPTFNDCASDIPPVDNLFKYTKMGFDLVSFSGGKGLRGPQSAGLLLGKKKCIEAAKLHTPPNVNVGRGMKVNKEEIVGMLIALELYLATDHDKEWERWETQIDYIQKAVDGVAGVTSEVYLPEIANEVPTLRVTWDQTKVKATYADIRTQLRFGHPAIEIWPDDSSMQITSWMMQPGQERAVAQRVREVLQSASE